MQLLCQDGTSWNEGFPAQNLSQSDTCIGEFNDMMTA